MSTLQRAAHVAGVHAVSFCYVDLLKKLSLIFCCAGCRAFALDTRCKMRWESAPLTPESIDAFKQACEKFGFGPEQVTRTHFSLNTLELKMIVLP